MQDEPRVNVDRFIQTGGHQRYQESKCSPMKRAPGNGRAATWEKDITAQNLVLPGYTSTPA